MQIKVKTYIHIICLPDQKHVSKSTWKFSSGKHNQFLASTCATDVIQVSVCPRTSLKALRFWSVRTQAPPSSWRPTLHSGTHWSKSVGWQNQHFCKMKLFERFEVKAVLIFWWGEQPKNPNQNPVVLYKEMKHLKNQHVFSKVPNMQLLMKTSKHFMYGHKMLNQ